MSASAVRNVFPVVTAVAATLYLVAAVPREFVPDMAVAWAPAQAEMQQCVAGGRDADACLDEADGKALVERADLDARRDTAARRAGR